MSQKLKIIENSKPWYADGLPFKCTECGKCCTGAPGYIWLNEKEIQAIADHLNLSIKEFSIKYLRLAKGRLSLKEHPTTYDCVFLKDNKCEIYSVRPTQCRTFPWWPQNLKTEKDWQEAAKYCEGINLNAPLTPLDTIEHQRKIQEQAANAT
jgi:hypothetical protein